jgi:hypothetical protein
MRILITGASGSGTSTLGKSIADETGWKFLDADDYYYWLPSTPPYREKRERSERLELMLNDLNSNENSVVSGSVMNRGPEIENAFDLVVFLYLDTAIRVVRLKVREEREIEHADPAFLKWAADYDIGLAEGRHLASHQSWLLERDCQVLRIEGDLTVDERTEMLMNALLEKAAQGGLTQGSASVRRCN